MIKLYWFEFTRKIAVSLAGGRREVFEPWDRVVCGESDKLTLLRQWALLLDTKVIYYPDVFDWSAPRKAPAPKHTPNAVKKTKAKSKK